jgi:UDP-hydrolysing UDP-N-acetyl-D-glucosamine 2-epimerase
VVAGAALLDRYGNAVDFILKDGFTINEKVFMVLEGENKTAMAKTTGLGVMELANVFYNLQPDAVITIADRYETIATSIAASYQNIPLIHIQGGEVTGNIDEKVRHANTKLADIHLVASDDAAQRVLKLGEIPENIYNVGCPSIDLAYEVMQSPQLDFNPIEKYGGVGADFDLSEPYIVVMQHPVTTEYSRAKEDILKTIKAITELGINTYWFWPNVDAGSDGTSNGIRTFRERSKPTNLRFFKNMEPNDFLRLLVNSQCLIGNSSVGIRECAYMAVPVVNIGSRQNRRERGNNVVDVSHDKDAIKNAIESQLQNKAITCSEVYGQGTAGQKIADLLTHIELPFHKTITY